MLHLSTERMRSPSRPAMPAAAAAIARCCGDSILARTPPVLLPAATRVGDSPACAAATWSPPNSEFDAVTEPVMATPSQPINGEISAKTPPAPAAHSPIVTASPQKVHYIREREHGGDGENRAP